MMKQILIIALLVLVLRTVGHCQPGFSSAVPHTNTTINWSPSASGSRIAVDYSARKIYIHNGTTWLEYEQGIDRITGSVAPAYTPAAGQSLWAVNAANELYYYNSTWVCISCQQPIVTDATLTGDGADGNPLGLAKQGATTGQVLKWDGSAWSPSNDLSGGVATIDSVRVIASTSGIEVKVNTTMSPAVEVPVNALAQSAATVNQSVVWNGSDWVSTSFTPVDGTTIDHTVSGFGLTSEVKTNSLDSTHVKLRSLALNDIAPSGAVSGQIIKFDGTNWIAGYNENTIPEVTTSISTSFQDTIAKYGFLPCYVNSSGTFFAASTTDATTLHSCYINSYTGGKVSVLGAGSVVVTATFPYVRGQTYYLRDSGTLSTTADNDGDAQDFDSAVCSVIASYGSNQYLIILKDPRHFINN